MRIIFMGTPDFAVPTLMEIAARGYEIAAVYTKAPRPAGRGQAERPSAVQQAAKTLGLPIFTPKNFKDAAERDRFKELKADVAVVVAYGLLLPSDIVQAPRYGCLNLHGSLLPRWRGAAPIQRAVMAGDSRTGIMVMRMEEGLDTGPIGLVEEMPISPAMSAGDVHDEMMRRGADLMGRGLAALQRGSLTFSPQSTEGVTYAKKIDKAEARIDWSQSAHEVHNKVRGLSPFPGAWFEFLHKGKPVRVKVLAAEPATGSAAPGTVLDGLRIACGTDAIRLTRVQRAGGGVMSAKDFLHGTGELAGIRI